MDLERIIKDNPSYLSTQIISLTEQAQNSRSKIRNLQD